MSQVRNSATWDTVDWSVENPIVIDQLKNTLHCGVSLNRLGPANKEITQHMKLELLSEDQTKVKHEDTQFEWVRCRASVVVTMETKN